jgi:hypothetical protein
MQSNEDFVEAILNKMESETSPPLIIEGLKIFTKLVNK